MTFTLSKKTRALWQIRIVFAFALVFLAVLFFSRYTIWFLLPAAIVTTVGLITAFIYLPFYFNSYKIVVNKSFISISKGVIIRTTNIMPYPRLVFAKSFTTPLSAAMELKCIMLKAARGWIFIPEIDCIYADYLLDNIRLMQK
ncbi:MAG: hypothetical protein IJE02_07570 [Clostridia bacterium]|nr:hypothetical protein [Clostridia bacterium]